MTESIKERLKAEVRETRDLPTLPTTVARLLGLVDNPRSTAAKLGDVISTDPVLTAKLLKVANSAFYGFPRKIATLNLAIVVLGFSALRELCVSVGVLDVWANEERGGGLQMKSFWQHSIATGAAARLLAKKVRYRVPGEAFVAGLIHDIGKLLLDQLANEEYEGVLSEARKGVRQVSEIEEEMLGLTHSQAGAWLCKHWNLPENLVGAVRKHHNEYELNNENGLTAVVKCADALVHRLGKGDSGNYKIYDFPSQLRRLCDIFKVNVESLPLDKLVEDFEAELEKSEAFMEITRGEVEKVGDEVNA